MTKLQFILTLHDKLAHLPPDDVEEHLNFYSEMIEDRMEEGLSEEAAVAAVGSVDTIAAQIAENLPPNSPAKSKRRLKTWEIVLLAVGAPVWLPLLIAAGAVVLSLYAALWAIVIALWSAFGALVGSGFGGVVTAVGLMAGHHLLAGLALLGAALTLAGLAIFLFFGCRAATVGTVWLAKKAVQNTRRRFSKKEVL